MSLMKWWISVVVLFVGGASVAQAQVNVPSARFSPVQVQEAENTRPFAEPGVFDYDGQMFAPVEFTNFEERAPTSGLYATVDKTYLSISRSGLPDQLPEDVFDTEYPVGNDYMSGNRYELGIMSKAGNGWGLIYESTKGVAFSGGQDYQISNPFLINTIVSHVGLNRTFRQALSQGGYFEPYFGIAYVNISDRTLEDTSVVVGGAAGQNRFKQNASNSAIGAHVGGRYSVNRGRFRYSADGSMAAMYNHQRYFAEDLLFIGQTVGVSELYDTDQSFVPAFDGRVEVAYMLTRDVGIRGGAQMLYMWDGIARSNNLTTGLNPNSNLGIGSGSVGIYDQSTIAAGFTFGLEWRR